jgi:ankyrin repeat protein
MLSRQIASLVFALLLSVAAIAQNTNEEFFAAARKGDAAAVKAFLDKGTDVNAKTQYGATALAYACDKGHVEVVRLLIERGADVNVRDTFYGEAPIGWASSKGYTEIVKMLLDKGARGVDRVLMAGVELGNAGMVKVALDKGGAIPVTLSMALAKAEKTGKTEIAEMLKKAGAVPPPPPTFQVDAETLQSYAGTYKGVVDFTLVVKEGKLTGGVPGQTPFTLGAMSKTTFTPLEFEGATVTFNLEGGKVVSLTWIRGEENLIFKRVEQK